MRDPKMPLQDLLVMGRQLECSNVQARHKRKINMSYNMKIQIKINLVKVKTSTNTCRYCGEE